MMGRAFIRVVWTLLRVTTMQLPDVLTVHVLIPVVQMQMLATTVQRQDVLMVHVHIQAV
jgi:hypothetical protein